MAKAKTKTTKSTTAAKSTKAAKPKHAMQRADYNKPIDSFFKKQPAQLREVLVELRKIVEQEVPDAKSAIKWGMPVYTLGSNNTMVIALGAHAAHVNLILAGPTKIFADPKGLLTGASKLGRHLKLTSVDELPKSDVRTWVKAAAKHARSA